MCGFFGMHAISPIQDSHLLKKCCITMRHRGPNDFGTWYSKDRRIGLAHVRLSIMDLSTAGHQPMSFQEQGLVIVYNGEIYNIQELKNKLQHEFKINSKINFQSAINGLHLQERKWVGTSDTEVLLAAYAKWGTECLQYLNGMFSFAIYDQKNHHIFMARDRAGEKPLFYCISKEGLLFSSELKALMEVPGFSKKINPSALNHYLTYGFVQGENSILNTCKKLQPGHAMIYNIPQKSHRIWKWWRPPALNGQNEMKTLNCTKIANQLEVLLEDSVGKQLVADVPVGILLSGGIDSSIITALAVRKSKNVKT